MAENNRRANFINFITHTQKFVFLFNNMNSRSFVWFSSYSFKKWENFFTTLNKIVNKTISTKNINVSYVNNWHSLHQKEKFNGNNNSIIL